MERGAPWLALGCGVGLGVLSYAALLRRLDQLERRLELQLTQAQGQDVRRSSSKDSGIHSATGGRTLLRRKVSSNQAQVIRAVLTGGPCGGKTTSISQVAERLQDLGLRVFILPEASTLMFTAGCPFPVGKSVSEQTAWESAKMRLQENLEDEFTKVASSGDTPTVLVCDRGLMDSKAYVASTDEWFSLLEDNHWSEEGLLDRYDVAVHMTTAASGAEQFFSTGSSGNNAARREDLQAARDCDERLKAAWKDHPASCIIDNSTAFEDKIKRVCNFVASETLDRMGRSVPASLKPSEGVKLLQTSLITYLVTKGTVQESFPILKEETPSTLTHTFLSGSLDRVLRRRHREGASTHILSTRRHDGRGGADITQTKRISRRAYNELMNEADPTLQPVEILRSAIVVEGIIIKVSTVTSPVELQLLSMDTINDSFPKWQESLGLKDISKDPLYSLRGLACGAEPTSPGFVSVPEVPLCRERQKSRQL